MTACSISCPPLAQGVGKSATIRSLLGQEQPAGYRETSRVQLISGEIPGTGIPVTFIDTPGLEPAAGAPPGPGWSGPPAERGSTRATHIALPPLCGG